MAEYSVADNTTQQWETVKCVTLLFIYYILPLAVLFDSIQSLL